VYPHVKCVGAHSGSPSLEGTGRLGQEPGSDCLDEDIWNYQSTFENISDMIRKLLHVPLQIASHCRASLQLHSVQHFTVHCHGLR
jgi:hypothetical protein